MDKCFVVAVCAYIYTFCVCVCVCVFWLIWTVHTDCLVFWPCALSNHSQQRGSAKQRCPIPSPAGSGCLLYRNLCLPFIVCLSSHLLISTPPPMFLSRGLVTAVKPCIKALTYSVLPLLLPLSLPPWFYPSTLCWSVTPPQQLHWPALPLQRSYLQLMLWSW